MQDAAKAPAAAELAGDAAGGAAADGYVLDDQVGFLLRKAWQRHVVIFAGRMAEGLTPMQFSVLCRLSELGTCSQNQLGRSVAMDAATTKGVVGRLSARGFVAAVPDPEDRRRLLLSLTAEGRDALGEALPRAAAITEETLAPLTPAERRTLVRLLRKLQ